MRWAWSWWAEAADGARADRTLVRRPHECGARSAGAIAAGRRRPLAGAAGARWGVAAFAAPAGALAGALERPPPAAQGRRGPRAARQPGSGRPGGLGAGARRRRPERVDR